MLFIGLEHLESTCGQITGDLTLFKEHGVNAINPDIVQIEVQVTRLEGEAEGKVKETRIMKVLYRAGRQEGDVGAREAGEIICHGSGGESINEV